MRKFFLIAASLALLAVIAQFYFAGVGAFHRPFGRDGFTLHVINASVVLGTLLLAALWASAFEYTVAGRSRAALALLAAAVVGTALRIGIVGGLAASGWWFAQEKVLLTLPLVVVPGVAAVVLA